MSIRFIGLRSFSTGANNLLSSQAADGYAFRARLNTLAGAGLSPDTLINKAGAFPAIFGFGVSGGQVGGATAGIVSTGGTRSFVVPFRPATTNHIVLSYASGLQQLFLDGAPFLSASLVGNTGAYAGALVLGTSFQIAVDLELDDLSFWNGYAPTQADAYNLCVGNNTPLTLGTPATAWFTLSGAIGANPAFGDPGFHDQAGHGYTFVSASGTATNAAYTAPLGFATNVEADLYVGKSGKAVFLFPVAVTPEVTGYYTPQVPTAVAAHPAITWNGKLLTGTGPSTYGSSTNRLPWISYLLNCGSALRACVAKGGTGYTAPVVTAATADGNGVAPTFGTPTLKAGVITSVPLASAGSGMTALPVCTVADPTGNSAAITVFMSGVSPADVLTYTLPWGSIMTAIGGIGSSPPPGSSTPSSIANYSGTAGLEGPTGKLQGFTTARTMQLGINAGATPGDFATGVTTFANYLKKSGGDGGWSAAGGKPILTFDGMPTTWTGSTTITNEFYSSLGQPNPVDGRATPIITGTWAVVYTDTQIGVSGGFASTVTLSTHAGPITTTPVGSPTVVGQVVTALYDVAYVGDPPASYGAALQLNVTNANRTFYLRDVRILPPGNDVADADPLAGEFNFINAITTPGGKVPHVFRFMETNTNTGGYTAFTDPSDLQPATAQTWGGSFVPAAYPGSLDPNGVAIGSGTVTCIAYRAYNTNPADSTYAWSSPNLYMGQLGQWGAETGTDPTLGPYITLPPTDNGLFIYGTIGANPAQVVPVEIVTSAPHGIRTGLPVFFRTPSGSPFTLAGIPVAGFPSITVGIPLNQVNFPLRGYATGPTTFVVPANQFAPSAPTGTTLSRVGGTSETSLVGVLGGILGIIQIATASWVPYEFDAALSAEVGNVPWYNIPNYATDATALAMAQSCLPLLPPDRKVLLEYNNEHWNGGDFNVTSCISQGRLMAYLPVGTRIGQYYRTTGAALSGDQWYVLRLSNYVDIWNGVGASLGRTAAVEGIYGSQWSNSQPTNSMMAFAQQHGIPMGYLSQAPYTNMFSDAPFLAACSAAGSAGTPGNWPADAIADLVRHCIYYDTAYWGFYSASAKIVLAWGQPLLPMAPTLLSSTGGGLPTGGYYLYCTFEDPSGRETTVGNSQTFLAINGTGNTFNVPLPALPGAIPAGTVDVYLTRWGQVAGTQVLYKSGLTPGSTFVLGPGTYEDPARTPPSTNQVPMAAPPQMAAYEFSPQKLLPSGTPNENMLSFDIFNGPWFHDIATTLVASLQVGDPRVPDSGTSLATWFEGFGFYSVDGGVWTSNFSTSIPPGYGLSNRFSTQQGGLPADGVVHFGEAPGMQALKDWWDGTVVPKALTLAPASATVALGGTLGLVPILSGSTASLAASAINGTVPGPVATGTAFVYQAPVAGTSDTITVTDETDGLTATCSVTLINTPVVSGAWYIPALDFAFGSAIDATALSIVVTANGASFPGTATYNAGTGVATFAPTASFVVGQTYIATVSGATSPSGTPMAPVTVTFTPVSSVPGKAWFGGLVRI